MRFSFKYYISKLRGKVFWPWMSKQAHKLVATCEPCMRLARSNTQEKVEIKHTTLFNTHPGHTVHADFFELNHRDYIILVDRLTGFARCEATKNKGTDAAIQAIKNWGDLYGFPYKIIADGGPAFREDFVGKLLTLNIGHVPSTTYHPQSNSLAERSVQSVKSGLKKSVVRLTSLHLNELLFAINTTTSKEGTGSPADRFFGTSIRGRLPNSFDPEIKSQELIEKRILNHDARVTNKNKKNKILYKVGQRVRLQNVGTKDWDLKGTVERLRYADDGRVVSYYIMTDTNNLTTRHRRYLKPLHPEHDPRNKENDKIIAHNPDAAIADLPILNETVPRRSARHSKVKTVRTSTYPVNSSPDIMGAELSSLEAPISVNFELKVGEEELAKVREWWRQVDGTRNHRQGNDTRGAHNTGGSGNAATGGGGATRTVSNGTRQQGNVCPCVKWLTGWEG